MASATNPSICQWSASLYNDRKRKWFYGILSVLSDGIMFETSDQSSTVPKVKIPYTEICHVQKSQTGLVFRAIYFVKNNGDKLWVSSLEDRDSVYAAVKHFSMSALLRGNMKVQQDNAGPSQTKTGQKLLGIVSDSEKTLSQAAVQLHGQGQQFDHMLTNMFDIHNDLDVAEALVEDLDSWFGRWRLPAQYASVDPVIINKSDIPELFEFEVLLAKLDPQKMTSKRIGTMRLSKDGITLLNEKMKTEHHYNWCDVSRIRVVTPWEICITQYKIGQADLTYNVVSAVMTGVIKVLDKSVKHKMQYDMPPEKILVTSHQRKETSRTAYKKGIL